MAEIFNRFSKYVLVGGTATVIDFGLLYIFIDIFHIHYLTSAAMAFLIAATVHHFFSRSYVFKEQTEKTYVKTYVHFLAVASSGLILTLLLLSLFTEILKWDVFLSRAVIALFIGIWSFSMNNFVTFKKATR